MVISDFSHGERLVLVLSLTVFPDSSEATWSDFIQRSTRTIGSPALKAPKLVLGLAYGAEAEIEIRSFGGTVGRFFELLTHDFSLRACRRFSSF